MEYKSIFTKDIPSYRQLCDKETRTFTYFVQSLNKKNLIGVEIGTYKGLNSVSLLKELSIKKLYLVDPYTNFEDKVLKVNKKHMRRQNIIYVK